MTVRSLVALGMTMSDYGGGGREEAAIHGYLAIRI